MAPIQQPLGSGFGPRSTASEVLEGIDLTGRTALVTGGYSGLGLEITRALVGAGARVLVPARRPDVAEHALATQLAIGSVSVHPLDLADLASVASYADAVLASAPSLDLVIANAGTKERAPEQVNLREPRVPQGAKVLVHRHRHHDRRPFAVAPLSRDPWRTRSLNSAPCAPRTLKA